jgi:hypothetical protein
MEYVLSHKHIEVARIGIGADGLISSSSVLTPDHMPAPDGVPLYQWWYQRCIPNVRQGLSRYFKDSVHTSMHHLLPESLGLNLSDNYWIRPISSDLTWDDTNFFDNDFSENFGKGLIRGEVLDGHPSPDVATDGVLAKRWTVSGGRCRLIKSGTEPFRQEPVNEAVATAIMEAQRIPCAHYDLLWDECVPYSTCDCIVDSDTELVPAANIVHTSGVSKREAYEKACTDMGVDVNLAMAQQDFIDYMMMNGDRHLGNYGLIRDADTLEWIGPAPIFDTGTSLMCKRATKAIGKATDAGTSDAWMERLYRSDLDWLDIEALHRSIDDASIIIRSAAERLGDEGFDGERADALIAVLRSRAESLEDLFARDPIIQKEETRRFPAGVECFSELD